MTRLTRKNYSRYLRVYDADDKLLNGIKSTYEKSRLCKSKGGGG